MRKQPLNHFVRMLLTLLISLVGAVYIAYPLRIGLQQFYTDPWWVIPFMATSLLFTAGGYLLTYLIWPNDG